VSVTVISVIRTRDPQCSMRTRLGSNRLDSRLGSL